MVVYVVVPLLCVKCQEDRSVLRRTGISPSSVVFMRDLAGRTMKRMRQEREGERGRERERVRERERDHFEGRAGSVEDLRSTCV